MDNTFTAEFFKNNRRRMRESVNVNGPLVLTANGLVQRGGDIPYFFQQDAGFWYFTGINEPEIIVVMDGDDEYLLVPAREKVREAFDGAVSYDELSRTSGITKIYDLKEGWTRLQAKIKKSKQFGTLEPNPAYIDVYTMYTNPARAALVSKIKTANPNIGLVDLRKSAARLRMVKQLPEITAIQKAIDITCDSISAAVSNGRINELSYEYELEAEISYGFRKRGATRDCFDPVIAGGKNVATIHSMANKDPLLSGSLVIIDVGAEYDRYCADIARTYCIGGKPNKRQQAIYDAVAEAQDYAYGLLKPGVTMREYEKQIATFIGKKLIELKVIKTNNRENVRQYYPHACSHFLGLDPHDAGDYETPLAPGIIMTVEPGIYIPDENIGVRIEDDVIITETGIDVLSGQLPRSLTA